MTSALVVLVIYGVHTAGGFDSVMENAKGIQNYLSFTQTRTAEGELIPYGGLSIVSTLAWGLSIGTDIGGSATPIGASANVVGTSVVSKAGHPVSWGRYCKTAIPATIIVLGIAMIVIKLRYF